MKIENIVQRITDTIAYSLMVAKGGPAVVTATGTEPHRADVSSETDAKVATLAKEMISAIPTAGVISEKAFLLNVVSTVSSGIVTWFLNERQNRKTLVADEQYSEPAHWYTRWWRKSSCVNKSTESPVFSPAAARDFAKIKGIINEAVEKGGILPHAIFTGPFGTGKSMACASLVRGAKVNYYVTKEQDFIEFLQNSDDVVRFFKELRSCHYPTILIIDEAKLLLAPEKEINQDKETHRAFQVFKTYSGTKNNKVMFLFNTNVEGMNSVFSDRMSYHVYLGAPGVNELKEIVLRQAEKSFGPSALGVFTPKVIDYLVQGDGSTQGVFLGKSGRHVEEAFAMAKGEIGADLSKQTQESLHAIFSEGFNSSNKNRS